MSKITVNNTDNSDWDGDSRPDQNFNNVTINAFAYRNEREEINASNDSAMFTMHIQMSNGDTLQIRGDQYDARDSKVGFLSITAGSSNHLRYAGYQYCTGGTMTWIIFQNVDSGTWMNLNWSNISSKPLSEVALPGSHDAGMSVLNYSSAFSTHDNTQTQKYSIHDQLNKGSRYFDLRPMIWSDKVGSSDFYCGHFSVISGLGAQGSLGQSLTSVLSDVRSFVTNSANSHEIVVLKFSHYMDIDNDGQGFTDSQKTDLKNFVIDQIGDLLYTSTNANINLGQISLATIQSSGKRVIAVFDSMSSLADSNSGIFTFGSESSSKNYRLYDNYSQSNDFSDMANDQINKFNSFTSANGSMFLLSWTLTEGWTDYVDSSISDLAKTADSNLWYYLYVMVVNGTMSRTKVPNILYLDYFDSSYYFAEAAYFLNCYRQV